MSPRPVRMRFPFGETEVVTERHFEVGEVVDFDGNPLVVAAVQASDDDCALVVLSPAVLHGSTPGTPPKAVNARTARHTLARNGAQARPPGIEPAR